MDLICRQAVIDALVSETCYVDEEEIREVVNGSALKQREWIGGILDAIQAVKEVHQVISAREVVLCKDCKHWIKDTTDHTCEMTGDLRRFNFYCADGEKKESD